MKKILLIGDSIRIGYDKSVKKSLEGIAEVYFPEENCRFACYVLRYVPEYARLSGDDRFDVIHWNAGLWDCLRMCEEEPQTPLEVYGYYIERICQRIKKLFPEAAVIFATSTSVLTEQMSPTFIRYNSDIEAYNNLAVEIVKKYGFAVNDLYAASCTLPKDAHSDPVHYYTPVATEVFTKQVLSSIKNALNITEEIPYQEVLHIED